MNDPARSRPHAGALRWLYLPGLGTGPRSVKGRALAERLAARGASLRCLDLRVPDFRRMRVAAMVDVARAAIGGETDAAVVIGTSLGGLVAARLAATDPRVAALVLYAPALDLGGLRARRPALSWCWEKLGWLPVLDKTARRVRAVDAGLLRELHALGAAPPEVRVPTIVLHGRRDRTVDVESSRRFAVSRPHVELIELDDGHDLFASMPAVLAHTERFLSPWLAGD